MTEIHLTADTDVWTSASTCAKIAAQRATDAVVVAGLTDATHLRRFEPTRVVGCNVGGLLGALNLSRVLRRLAGTEFRVVLHSPDVAKQVESALKIVGRPEPFELVVAPEVEFPPVEVAGPEANAVPLMMWLGNITEKCGLSELIDHLGGQSTRPWRLRVVGQGKAKVVAPILKKCKKLDIADRIEWVGYSSNPYVQMAGVTLGIATNSSTVAREFAAASIPVITTLSQLSL